MKEGSGKPVSPWLILGAGLAAVLFSIYLAFALEPKEVGPKVLIAFIAESGFAGIIAVLIIWAVDRREKEEFRNYIQRSDRRLAVRNILAYASDLDVPANISHEIEKYLSATPFIKNFQDYVIEIRKIGIDSVRIRFDTTVEYQNVSQTTQVLKHRTLLTRRPVASSGGTLNRLLSLRADLLGEEDEPRRNLCDIDLSELQIDSLEYEEVLKAEIAPGGKLRMTIAAEKVSNLNGSDLVRQLHLCGRMKFEFVFDRTEFDLNTVLFCSGGENSSLIKTAAGARLEIDRPFLVNNGIVFQWHPITPTGSENAVAGSTP
jgi:hypothetical protein